MTMMFGVRIVGLPAPEARLIGSLLEGHGFDVITSDGPAPGAATVEPAAVLTARQVEVLRALRRHGSAPEAGRALGISVRTVNAHLNEIYARLGVHRAVQAICWACRRGLLDD